MAGGDSDEATRLLGAAASLLEAVGADRDRVPGRVAADCRLAADLLWRAGGLPQPAVVHAADPGATIREAMTALSKLSDAQLSSAPTMTAVQIILRVFLRIGRPHSP